MKKQTSLVLGMVLGCMLISGTSWGQSSTYNGKMALLLEPYFNIQKSLANDSIEGVAQNAQRFARLIQGIGLLVADKLPPGGKNKLIQLKRAAGGMRSKDILVVRQYFKILSRTFIEYLEMVGLPKSIKDTPIYVFHCPMSDAYWMQTQRELFNPFYGSLMLKSGQFEWKLQTKVSSAYNGF